MPTCGIMGGGQKEKSVGEGGKREVLSVKCSLLTRKRETEKTQNEKLGKKKEKRKKKREEKIKKKDMK